MPVIHVDNQQSPIPRPLLVVRTRNKSRSSSRKRKDVFSVPSNYHSVRAITPDLLWSYISERVVGLDPNTKRSVLRGLKYAILWPNQWPEWLHARVKSEDLAAKLIGVDLEPAWTQSIAHQLMDMERRANNRWRFESDDDSLPASRVRNPAEDLLGY